MTRMLPIMRASRTAHGAARHPLGVALVLFLLSAAVPAAAMDTPLEGIPLPRYLARALLAVALYGQEERHKPVSRAL